MEDTRITFETAKLAKEKGFPQEPNRLKIPYYNYKGEFKGDVKDYNKLTITEKQHKLFRSYAIPLLKKVFKFNKSKAENTFDWFLLQYGLNIKN